MRLAEIFSHRLFDDRRRKGAKCLAVLDAPVQNVFHLRPSRIGEDAAISERARAPLGGTLIPADDFSGGNVARRGLQAARLRRVPRMWTSSLSRTRVSAARISAGWRIRAPIGVFHHEFARAAENLMIHGESGSHGKSGIACGRLDENLFKR